MLSVLYSPKALQDLTSLEAYLAKRFYPANAARYIDRIRTACTNLRFSPHRQLRGDTPGDKVRIAGFERNIKIQFVLENDQLIILRILYRARTFGRAKH